MYPSATKPQGISNTHLLVRRWWEVVAVAAVIGLAAFLRLGFVGINWFGFDEARVSLMALQMAQNGRFATLGMQSSTGVPNFPAAVWIFALPFRFSADPLWANLFVGFLNTLAVIGSWWLARHAWGSWAGLTTALLFAASPYLVFYSRSIWSQNLLTPLAVLWALTAVYAVAHDQYWALALHAFLAGFTLQVHLAGVVLIFGSLWLGLRYRLWRRWRPIVGGGLLSALSAAPYVYTILRYGDGARLDWQRVLEQPATINDDVVLSLAHLGGGLRWERLLLGADWQWPEPLATTLQATGYAAIALIGLGILLATVQAWRARAAAPNRRDVLATLLPVWVLITPLYFYRFRTDIGPHYLLATLPALFITAGAVAGWRRKSWWGAAVTAIALLIVLPQTVATTRAVTTVGQRRTSGGIGTPLRYPRQAAQALMDGAPIAVHTFGDIPEYFGDAATFNVLLWHYPHRIVDGRSAILIPQANSPEPAHLLSTYGNLAAWEELQAHGLLSKVQELPRREGELPYVAATVETADFNHFRQLREPIRLSNGASLLGWHVRPHSNGWRVATLWQLNDPILLSDYHQFNHFRTTNTQDGQPFAVNDVRPSTPAWQAGDILITWADFDPGDRAGPFWVDVGMYTFPDINRVPRLDHNGDPLAPIRLGPFE